MSRPGDKVPNAPIHIPYTRSYNEASIAPVNISHSRQNQKTSYEQMNIPNAKPNYEPSHQLSNIPNSGQTQFESSNKYIKMPDPLNEPFNILRSDYRKHFVPSPNSIEFQDQFEPQQINRNRNYRELPNTYHTRLNRRNQINYPDQDLNRSVRTESTPRDSYLRRLITLPAFSGESYKELKNFIEVADGLFHTATMEIENKEFYDQMITQLRGEARVIVLAMDNYDWLNIKKKLLQHFEYLSNKNVLASQIENLRQEKDETLSQYAERARKLLNEKNMTYTYISEEQRTEHNRTARKAFAKGIKNDTLKDRMLIRGASSLEDAIAYALEAESDTLTQIQKSELFCKTCRIPGHRQAECRRSGSGNDGIDKLVAALQQLGNGGRNNFSNFQKNGPFNNGMRNDNNFYQNGQNNSQNWDNSDNFNQNWKGQTNFANHNWKKDGYNFNGQNDQFNQFYQNGQNCQRGNNFQPNQQMNAVQIGHAQERYDSEN